MRTWQIWAVALAVGASAVGGARGQTARSPFAPPAYKYAVSPQAGPWLICVQTYKGPQAKVLAEELAELIQKNYGLTAYLFDRGFKERTEEQKHIRDLRQNYDTMLAQLKTQGIEPVQTPFRVRTFLNEIEDEYAVLVCRPKRELKDIDAARDFLNDIRKLKPPPEKFTNKAIVGDEDPSGKKITQVGYAFLNPFLTAMVVHNPTITMIKEQDDPEVADALLKEMNSGEEFSVLKCAKPWTLVVKVYQGQVSMQTPKGPSLLSRIGLGKREGDALSAGAAQAHMIATVLRTTKPSYEAHVMHQRKYSIVTVGQFDSQNDPNLLATQKALAGLQLKENKSGIVMETLNAQPLPMKIPR